jgi:hypothetical protein
MTFAVGTLMVLTLGAAWLQVEHDEAGNDSETAECRAQPEATARKARRVLVAEHVESDRAAAKGWFIDAFPTPADLARQTVDSIQDEGTSVSGRLPAKGDDGFVVVVMYDPAGKLPSLPSCVEDTPVIYVGTGPRVAG